MTGRPAAIAVVGATATGKSDLAMDLALELGGEIINADAMQFYRGMDIGTAKVPIEERRGIAHHLLDILDVDQDASVANYQADARALVSALTSRHRPAVLVGGSGLYVRSVVDDLQFPGTDPAIRAGLERRAEAEGLAVLADELARLDPKAASTIKTADARRVIRALEVIELTGEPFSATLPEYRYVMPAVQIGLALERTILHERINARVDAMFAGGLVDEVARLDKAGLRRGTSARRAIGYAQLLDHFDGRCTLDQAKDSIKTATRQFAKRQETWFKRDPRIHVLDVGAGPAAVREAALRLARNGSPTMGE